MAERELTIAVVSDTHMPRFGKALPAELRRGFDAHAVDLILHCGDLTDVSTPAVFEAVAPFEAVAGNNDPPALHERFGERKILEFGKVRIGMTHGHAGIGRSTQARAENAFKDERVDAILYGHSHIPQCTWREDGVLLFNPGSPTDKRRQPNYSYGILRIDGGKIAAELVYYADKS